MNELFVDTGNMISIVVIACLIVLGAMIIDLVSGLQKARQRGEFRSSWGLKRTLTKFITYEGGMLIAAGVDLLMHFCHIMELFHLSTLAGVPIVTCMLGIFLLVVEFISVKEKADQKTRTEFARVGEIAANMVNKDELVEALTKAIIESRKESK